MLPVPLGTGGTSSWSPCPTSLFQCRVWQSVFGSGLPACGTGCQPDAAPDLAAPASCCSTTGTAWRRRKRCDPCGPTCGCCCSESLWVVQVRQRWPPLQQRLCRQQVRGQHCSSSSRRIGCGHRGTSASTRVCPCRGCGAATRCCSLGGLRPSGSARGCCIGWRRAWAPVWCCRGWRRRRGVGVTGWSGDDAEVVLPPAGSLRLWVGLGVVSQSPGNDGCHQIRQVRKVGGICGLLVSRVGLLCVVLLPSGCFVRCVAGARRKHGIVSCCFAY
jgi:hypothetical protein